MIKRYQDALAFFEKNSPCEMPSGAGSQTRASFLARKWIVRTERLEDFGPELYHITAAGFNALQDDRENEFE